MLTVHQAKGLEFDIVIVPDLAAKTARSNGDRTFFSDRWAFSPERRTVSSKTAASFADSHG